MANKTIGDLTAASLPLDLTELLIITQGVNSRKVAVGDFMGEIKWLSARIGEPIAIWDHLSGADIPPTDSPNFRFIKLTSGLTGSGQYNEGVLTSESVTGSAPLVIATAVIDDAASPMDGQSVSLINTERRFIRAGSSGAVEQDAIQGHIHRTSANVTLYVGSGQPYNMAGGSSVGFVASDTTGPLTDGTSGTPRNANETRGKNIGATYYMRIS